MTPEESLRLLDITEARWRFEERVTNLMNRGRTRTEAEEIVKRVITTKELEPEVPDEPCTR